MKNISLIIFAILFLVSCQKQPTACFNTDSLEYISGDTIHISNNSINADKFEWYLFDSLVSEDKCPNIIIDKNTQFVDLDLRLEAFSKNKKKNSTASKILRIIPASIFGLKGINVFHPLNTHIDSNNSLWRLYASDVYLKKDPIYKSSSSELIIYFYKNGNKVDTGNYTVTTNSVLQSHEAKIYYTDRWWELQSESLLAVAGAIHIAVQNGNYVVKFDSILMNSPNKFLFGKLIAL